MDWAGAGLAVRAQKGLEFRGSKGTALTGVRLAMATGNQWKPGRGAAVLPQLAGNGCQNHFQFQHDVIFHHETRGAHGAQRIAAKELRVGL